MSNLKNIVVIGPIYPYRGGISHYNSLMCMALKQQYNVRVISYKVQYPKFLFKKQQKEYGNSDLEMKDAKFWINTVNPLNWISSAWTIKKMEPDLVIFQWWHPYFAPCYWTMEQILGNRIKKMFVCHNVFPHESFFMDKFLTKMVLKKGDYYLTHSDKDTKDLIFVKNNARYAHTVIPTLNVFKANNMSESEARKILNVQSQEKILLFFGFVREYKGLRYIIEALPEIIASIKNIKLYIVGEFGEIKEEYLKLIERLEVKSYVKIIDGYIPDNEVAKYFMASDVVVLPYESATQSGIVQTAYNFNVPVIVTDVGGLPEVVEDGRTGYIVPAKNPKELAKAVIQYFQDEKKCEFQKNIIKNSDRYSWNKIVGIIDELYNR